MNLNTKKIADTKIIIISASEISAQTGIEIDVITNALENFKSEDGQGDTVHVDDTEQMIYADKTAFYELASTLDIDETVAQTILEALGEFSQPQKVVA